MKLYLFAAGHAFGVVALKNYLGLDCEIVHLDYRGSATRRGGGQKEITRRWAKRAARPG